LARQLGLGELLVKDETARFGLNAFKATGALFAIATLVERGELQPGSLVACASEGNHGRAVAHAARAARCGARVYMSRSVARARVEAIESEGATVVLVDGTYDDAVRLMAEEATAHGWAIISDTSWAGYTEIPRLIMLGYTRIMDEIAAAMGDDRLDAVFVPAGVGGLLAAVACWEDLQYGHRRAKVVAVEPLTAACVQVSVRAGAPTAVPGPFDTTMGGLRCGEMSPSVFPAVASLVDGFVAIEDEFAFAAMRQLARPAAGDPIVECASSGAAALGGLLAARTDSTLSGFFDDLGLDNSSRIAVLVTEGVTDPAVVNRVLARP
jgi:diaminopropionate ammonia-lyase